MMSVHNTLFKQLYFLVIFYYRKNFNCQFSGLPEEEGGGGVVLEEEGEGGLI